MTRFVPRTRTGRVLTATGAAFALVAGAGVLSTTAATAATAPGSSSTSAPAPSSTATPSTGSKTKGTGVPYRAISPAAIRVLVGDVPSALRTDVKALKGKKGSDRRDAVIAIEKKALSGGYGSAVDGIATKAQAAAKDAPAALKTDLRSLKGMDKDARIKELGTIESKSLSGGYGSSVETYAKSLRDMAAKTAETKAAPVLGSVL